MTVQSIASRLTRWGLVSAAAAGFALSAEAQEFTIKIGHIASTTDEDHKGALVFQDFVQSQTNERVKVEIYPARSRSPAPRSAVPPICCLSCR